MSLLIAVPPRGTNKHTQDRKKCSLLDDNSTTTADYNSAHANYTVNYIRQLQNHDYIHMTTTTSYKSILLHVTLSFCNFVFLRKQKTKKLPAFEVRYVCKKALLVNKI